jgi:hypothetical protein
MKHFEANRQVDGGVPPIPTQPRAAYCLGLNLAYRMEIVTLHRFEFQENVLNIRWKSSFLKC